MKKILADYARAGILLVTITAFVFCTRDYNPFSDAKNVNSYVTSWTFSGSDSVALYQTGIFNVALAVREEVDSFVVSSPKNRYWTDTTIKRSGSNGMLNQAYTFEVSFFDTGYAITNIQTYRSDGNALTQEFGTRVFNPLHQMNVTGFFGDTITLLTINVADKNILYHWRFGNSWSDYSTTSRLSAVMQVFSPPRGSGVLWVSDLQGNSASPPVGFAYSFKDTSAPDIKCINSGLHGDTIISGDTVFPFRVIIADAGSAEVESCSVNDSAFDFVNKSGGVYTKVFSDLPKLAGGSRVLTVNVFALDNVFSRNTSQKTFYVRFEAAGQKSDDVTISFDQPAKDTVVTNAVNRTFRIHGVAQSIRGENITLVCRANEKEVLSRGTISGTAEWSWLVPLDSLITSVTVAAYDGENRLLASAGRVIIFQPNAVDIVKPVLWQVSSGGEIVGSEFNTKLERCDLQIVAFDEGVGLDYLLINQDTLQADTSFTWYSSISGLVHGKNQGKIVNIVAVDKSGNRQERTIVIYKNSVPELTTTPFPLTEECCAEVISTWQVVSKDEDGDNYNWNFLKKPAAMSFVNDDDNVAIKTVTWQPVERPGTNKDTLIIELDDGYPNQKRYQWEFTINRCSKSTANFKFKTTHDDFPGVLQAGFDQLNVPLSIDSTVSALRPRYSARLVGDRMLLDNDTSCILKWTPSPADTGYKKMLITVGDGNQNFDTLLPAIQVVPKNQYPCSLSVAFSGTRTIAGYLDMYSHPKPETLSFAIHDKDNLLTESYRVTIKIGASRSVQTLNRRDFVVVVDRDLSKMTDTLIAMVSDSTNTTCTNRQIMQYYPSAANIPPDTASGPGFPPFFCSNQEYRYEIKVSDANEDTVVVLPQRVPTGMTVSSGGVVEWTPTIDAIGDDTLMVILFDQRDSSGPFSWPVSVVDCENMPPAVSFKTDITEFPDLLQAEVDSLVVQLEVAPGTGVLPFTYAVTLDGRSILNDDGGKLIWTPLASDTGVCTLTITVSDRYNRVDTLLPVITVVPRNSNQCKLAFEYSGPKLPSGQLTLFASAQPESALFVIQDIDHPATEKYTVKIARRGSSTTTLNLKGTQRSFPVKVAASTSSTVTSDTILVSIKDSTGTVDTSRLFIRYPIAKLSEVPQLSLTLDASTNVTTSMGSTRVSRWVDQANLYGTAVSQQETNRQPNLVQNIVNGVPAILFDRTSGVEDGLSSTSYREWAAAPFTVFVVFSMRTTTTTARQTLVSTNTSSGFAVGIGCDQTISVFNDITSQGCDNLEWASTGLSVTPKTWYVASFESSLGITLRGDIQVEAWLNGSAAPQSAQLETQSDAGLSVGTGSSGSGGGWGYPSGGYYGSFDGWIASVIIYQRAVSDDERNLIERYLGKRYGVTIP